ncbi:hypothetical protein [uncultured Imperialibacter sp.]
MNWFYSEVNWFGKKTNWCDKMRGQLRSEEGGSREKGEPARFGREMVR